MAAKVTEFPQQEESNGWVALRLLGRAATCIGGGAVVGAVLKGQDLSSLKGLGKLCAGIGIIGLSHAAGGAAGDAIEKDISNLQFASKLLMPAFEDDDEEEDE